MRTPSNLSVTLSPLSSTCPPLTTLGTPHSIGSPLRHIFSEDANTPLTIDHSDPISLQIQGLLPLLDSSLSDDTIIGALDKLQQVANHIILEQAKEATGDSGVDRRLRLAICRLEKLQAKVPSAFIQIKVAEVILLAAPEGLFYPSQCYQLYRLSKDPGNDAHFRQTGIIAQLLNVLRSPVETDTGTLTLVAATLSHVLEDPAICKSIAREHSGIALLGQVLQRIVTSTIAKPMHQEKNVNFLIQLTSCLRNLSEPPKNAKKFAELGLLPPVLSILQHLSHYKDLVLNASRILAKVSLQYECRVHINSGTGDIANLQAILLALDKYCTLPAIVDRLCFTLGNLTHTTDNNRVLVIQGLNGLPIVTKLLVTLLAADEQASGDVKEVKVEDVGRSGRAFLAKEELEGALIRILRLIGNLAISREVGPQLCASREIANSLFDILGRKGVAESEELVLNAVSCVTNLSFYEVVANEILTRHHEVTTPLALLVLHDHPEVVHESVQAFGNFSRKHETRAWMIEKRLDEALVILLDHSDAAVVMAVAGVLMNFSADPAHMHVFHHFGALPKLLEWLDEFNDHASEDGLPTLERVVKIFFNLAEGDFFQEAGIAASVYSRLAQLGDNMASVEPAPPALKELAQLTVVTLQAIAQQCPPGAKSELEEL